MKRGYRYIHQLKVTLEDVEPPVWRRIQVPESYSFWDLNVAIQDAMGWLDYHLHQFNLIDPRTGLRVLIGIPNDEGDLDYETLPGHDHWISDYFSPENSKADYLYDFGDDWTHSIELEEVLPRQEGVAYPACVAGERACPPEDCGGFDGYADFLEIITDPNHEEHDEMLTWAGGDFDPERFEPVAVNFADPAVRWRIAFLHEEHPDEPFPAHSSPVIYTNRREDCYYLHVGQSKTGKPAYSLSRSPEGILPREIPEGYEIYENPDGRVFLRKIPPKVIGDEELRLVESAVKAAGIKDFLVDVKKGTVTVFLPDREEGWLEEIFAKTGLPPEYLRSRIPPRVMRSLQDYSPLLRFILDDKKKRSFYVERMCFMSLIDDWLNLEGPGDLKRLATKYCKHLGKESFYDLC